LSQLALKYKLPRVTIAELLNRVDVIPPSLALGQAVVETGWGGSLAAQNFNSPFGMMKSRKHVFSYNSLQESVSHYIHNLNTHDAYRLMRNIRSRLRNTGEQLCPLKLAEGLTKYSELGKIYTGRVKNIIKSFKLQQYDKARLTSFYQQQS
jgi:Bax protein